MSHDKLAALLDSDLGAGWPIAVGRCELAGRALPLFSGEFWTSGQRRAARLHEVSYRACFKPQLPAYFIRRFSAPGDLIHDPFSGRGTTALEAALAGRRVAAGDANPLSELLTRPRLAPPEPEAVRRRLEEIPLPAGARAGIDLSMFFHPHTESEIVGLREHLRQRRETGREDEADAWIRMVATSRLTGHSPGFFSVYTLPPNQALSPERQRLINQSRRQAPEYRDTKALILRKSAQLLQGLSPEQRDRLRRAAASARLFTGDARRAPLEDGCARLVVTSPPFLDLVQYAADNWLRCWFNGLDAEEVGSRITQARDLGEWTSAMAEVFGELRRLLAPGGRVAFEVGELRKGRVRLEEAALAAGERAGLRGEALLVNRQAFTKTANIWGVRNNELGTNSNRIVLFRRD
jgi:hypothetical protein